MKTASRCQQVTVKRVIATEPNHLNRFIEESLMLLRDAKLCMGAVFGIIFVVEIEQKQYVSMMSKTQVS